jgi:L-Ala-D/L-Glu epimerase / N-acetyl-D-glutamate racemase
MGLNMKIEKLEIFPVKLELTVEHRSSLTRTQHIEDVYIRIVTESGAYGYGATAPKYYITGETQGTVVTVLQKNISPVILGEDAFDIERINDRMNHAIKGNTSAKAAVDIALYDLIGRTLNIPVYKLLGGSCRSEMAAFDLIGLWSPEEAVERATQRMSEGYREFKVKVGPDPEADSERVLAVGETLKGLPLKVDANQAWTPKEAVRFTRLYSKMGVSVVEQPVHMDNIEGLAMVRNSCPEVDIMADESIKSLSDARKLIELNAVDMFNIKLVKSGGLCNAKKIAAIAESAGMNCMAGCTLQNTLIDAATVHFLSATPNIICNEVKSPQWIRNDVASGLEISNGMVRVPEGPGLGLEMDEDRLKTLLL